MVGSEPDGQNQIGVAPGAKWIAVKAFSDDGGTDEDLLAAGNGFWRRKIKMATRTLKWLRMLSITRGQGSRD